VSASRPPDPEVIAERVLGRLRYTIDLVRPRMLHAALVRSPVATGRLEALDVAGALAIPGVVRVVLPADLRGIGLTDEAFGTMVPDQPFLAAGTIRHVGEPVAAVLAESEASAVRAVAAIRLSIVAGAEPLLDPRDALADGAPPLHAAKPDNVLARWSFAHGDLAAAEAATVHRVEGTYTSPAAQHVTMEPQVCVAEWAADGTLELWAATQSPNRIAAELERLFGLAAGTVRLHVRPLGGGYGGKNHAKLEPLAAALARVADRPVRILDRRSEEFVTTTKHAARVHLVSGVDGEGRFTFRRAELTWSSGAFAHSSLAVVRGGGLAVCGPYRMPAAAVASTMVYTNVPPAGSFRGLGANQAAWAGERQVDEIATAIGDDPIEFRRRNVVRAGDRLPTGEPIEEARWLDCLDDVAARLGLAGGSSAGAGVALAMKQTMTPSRSGVELVATTDGRVEVRSNLVDMGQGLRTVLARAAAEALDLPIERVDVAEPDTVAAPFDAGTFSSRGAWAGTTAVRSAAAALRARLELTAAGPAALAEAVRTSGEVAVAASAEVTNEAPVDPATGQATSTSHWHQGAVGVRVETDLETGIVRVTEAVGAAWAGRVIDPVRARLQNDGGLLFGMGPALIESLDHAAGPPSASTLLDYRVPSILDVPDRLETSALEHEDGHGEPTGIGESVIPAVASAIAAAIASVTGRPLRDLPLDPARVLGPASDAGAYDADPDTRPAGPAPWPIDRPAPVIPRPAVESDPVELRLLVDGTTRVVQADPLAGLGAVLLEALGPGAVRQPCGVGACGGCTVLLAGRAVRSCLVPAGLVGDRPVTTIAALGPDDPIAAELIARGAAQCGSCLPGFVLALRASFAADPTPDEAGIRSALAGNLCRCGSYGPILEAARAVAARGGPGGQAAEGDGGVRGSSVEPDPGPDASAGRN
jgi:CO/xanthine dehydrogenase Mo-binding subunit/aerobic-type carbon monoxide dehydrogenase small subunit (CoxS/CutS family)